MRQQRRDMSEVRAHIVPVLGPSVGAQGKGLGGRWWWPGGSLHHDAIADVISVFYAPDLPGEAQFVTRRDLKRLSLSPAELRELAVANLRRRLQVVDRHGGPETYMISTGSENEASLLLLDSFWRAGDLPVDGDFVASVPGCDVLMVTGSKCPRGLARLRQLGRESFQKSAYPLTPELLVRSAGSWAVLPGWQSAGDE